MADIPSWVHIGLGLIMAILGSFNPKLYLFVIIGVGLILWGVFKLFTRRKEHEARKKLHARIQANKVVQQHTQHVQQQNTQHQTHPHGAQHPTQQATVTQPHQHTHKYCPNCRAIIDKNYRFCPYCAFGV